MISHEQLINDRVDALHSYPPMDGGDNYSTNVVGWPVGIRWYVYECLSPAKDRSWRIVVPQSCTDSQVKDIVDAWLRGITT